jgi:hypothetical protein
MKLLELLRVRRLPLPNLDVPAAYFFVVKSDPGNKSRDFVDQAGSWGAFITDTCSLEILRKPKSVNRLSE